jgi:hypothetical protein
MLDNLKADLNELNMKCQLARDNEVRFALQRGRLEAERASLLVKMIEAVEAERPAPPPVPAMQPDIESEEDDEELAVELGRRGKPPGLPTYEQMVHRVLEHVSPRWLAPKQMTAMIQQTWWPGIAANKAASTAWGMARRGKIDKKGRRYRIKQPNGHVRDATAGISNGAAR